MSVATRERLAGLIAAEPFDGPVGDQKAVPVAMHADAARGVLPAAGDDGEMVGAGLDDLAALQQFVESRLQRFTVEVRLPEKLTESTSLVGQVLNML